MNAVIYHAPKATIKQRKTYTFWESSYPLHPALLIIETDRGTTAKYYVTPRQYDRFVELANSRRYDVQIVGSDYGTAWTLQRFPAGQ